MNTIINTALGSVKGNDRGSYKEYLGIRYATAKRFEYATPIDSWEGVYDATHFGAACPQTRGWYEHLEIPERMFYHKEFRAGQHFEYDEDCLSLNIYCPNNADNCPVIVMIHGGGFNSGASSESSFDGGAYANRGVIMVTIQYRVGILGYLTHEEIYKQYGHDGNFGLDDQILAIKWVKKHIKNFGGNPENITLLGQSAGAMSIQYMCISEEYRGLFKHAVMLSGAGLFPKFSLPRKPEETRNYWLNYMELTGCSDFEDLKKLSLDEIFAGIEKIKSIRKDNTYCTMPVIDGCHIAAPVDELIKNPLPLDYMIGFTNNDMYAVIMAHIGRKFAKAVGAYTYYFDIDAPGGDKNGAFHSSDLRYVFGTLIKSHRPYTEQDYDISQKMISYIVAFAENGNPNREWLPRWDKGGRKVLHISRKGMKMSRPCNIKLLWNTLTKGEPK